MKFFAFDLGVIDLIHSLQILYPGLSQSTFLLFVPPILLLQLIVLYQNIDKKSFICVFFDWFWAFYFLKQYFCFCLQPSFRWARRNYRMIFSMSQFFFVLCRPFRCMGNVRELLLFVWFVTHHLWSGLAIIIRHYLRLRSKAI